MEIDWSVFEGMSKTTCHCRCGTVYSSHAKGIGVKGEFQMITKTPCPACGKNVNNCRRYSTPPERWTL